MISTRLVVCVLAAAPVVSAAATPEAPPPVDFAIAHSYSSTKALGQPATFFLIGEEGKPPLSEVDAAVLLRGGLNAVTFLEGGVRAHAGSARSKSERAYGAVARGFRIMDPLALSLAGEYEADGGFDVEKGVVSAEVTPLHGLPGLGTKWSTRFPLRWRPWFGLGYGNVFDASATPDEDPESGGFWRAHGRLEAVYPMARLEVGAEGTVWLVEGGPRDRSYARGSLAYELGSGISFDLSGEVGRQPPRFDWVQGFKVGLGLHRTFAREKETE